MSVDAQLISRLHTRLAELAGEVSSREAERREELPEDFSEQAAALEVQDALEGIEAAHLAEARAIQAALARIRSGNYGICSNCGADIPAARLEALPTATTCINCAA
jgi:RNA polymerase-binding transcription factor DksA